MSTEDESFFVSLSCDDEVQEAVWESVENPCHNKQFQDLGMDRVVKVRMEVMYGIHRPVNAFKLQLGGDWI